VACLVIQCAVHLAFPKMHPIVMSVSLGSLSLLIDAGVPNTKLFLAGIPAIVPKRPQGRQALGARPGCLVCQKATHFGFLDTALVAETGRFGRRRCGKAPFSSAKQLQAERPKWTKSTKWKTSGSEPRPNPRMAAIPKNDCRELVDWLPSTPYHRIFSMTSSAGLGLLLVPTSQSLQFRTGDGGRGEQTG